MADIVIIGAGGHAVSVANVVHSTNHTLKGFADKSKAGETLLGFDVFEDEAAFFDSTTLFCIAIGVNATRERVASSIIAQIGIERFPAVIHASAEVGLLSRVGFGTVVMPNATIGPNSVIGNFCIMNTNASIDHDSSMADFSSLAPGANTGGTVSIGARSAVSLGAKVKHGVSIGSDVVIGANSFVNSDIESNTTAYGTPAKIIRSRTAKDTYL